MKVQSCASHFKTIAKHALSAILIYGMTEKHLFNEKYMNRGYKCIYIYI